MGGIASPKRWNNRVGGHERVRQLCLRLPAKFPRDLASLADHALYSAQVSGLWSACTNARLGWERGCISSSEEVYSVNLYTSQLDMRLDFYVWQFDIHPTWWYLVGTSQFGLHFPQHLFRFDSDSRHWDGVNVTTIDQSCGVAATGKTNQWANRLGSRKRSSEARLGLLRGGLVGGVVGSELGAVASST